MIRERICWEKERILKIKNSETQLMVSSALRFIELCMRCFRSYLFINVPGASEEPWHRGWVPWPSQGQQWSWNRKSLALALGKELNIKKTYSLYLSINTSLFLILLSIGQIKSIPRITLAFTDKVDIIMIKTTSSGEQPSTVNELPILGYDEHHWWPKGGHLRILDPQKPSSFTFFHILPHIWILAVP